MIVEEQKQPIVMRMSVKISLELSIAGLSCMMFDVLADSLKLL